ncbi:twin-arginine translocation signal domain-containing protein [Rhizobium sp. P38BS-XIX]|uniref:twin-arginine translocation signal domain-containing protein n=1 Tax=Rhizobium sp. P38BS-XIX TaxID=2726740 RepID=UPI00145762BD|nr:twin-arginine translocation signal domain-containing protein [Rhizobium sp. P38BS-XIX]NLS00689.1 twin-arginine translocation signal domain-containing protein [Rhizobium sp. P38BS-XIX]
MSTYLDPNALSEDELIVAYLDDELDATARLDVEDRLKRDGAFGERFEFLASNSVSMNAAFAALLDDAPVERMKSNLPVLELREQRRTVPTRRGFLAAACLAAGAVAGGGLVRLLSSGDATSSQDWRGVVADYMQLYSADTLSNLSDDPAMKADQIARVANVLQLPLTTQGLMISGIPFKRAQLLTFNEKPLAQIAYLDPKYGPLALCLTHSSTGKSDFQTEQRLGMNIVFWSSADHSFMVIGRNPPTQLQAIAAQLRPVLEG